MKRIITLLYETDVQNDFSLRSGALFVRGNDESTPWPFGAEKRLPNIYKLHEYAGKSNWGIAGSVDRHFYEDAELIRNRGGVFDDHGMNGTWGQLRLPGLEPQKDIYIRAKDGPLQDIRIYTQEELQKYIERAEQGKAHLIFEKQSYDVASNPNFGTTFRMLMDQGLEKVVLNGFATDYCDKAAVTAIAGLRDKYKPKLEIYLVTDAIEAVNIDFEGNRDPEFGNKAIKEMTEAEAKLITTEEVLEGMLR